MGLLENSKLADWASVPPWPSSWSSWCPRWHLPQVLTIHCGDLDADCLDLERSHVPRMLQRLGTPLVSASYLRIVNDKLNLRVIRPRLFLHDLHNIHLMLLFCKVWKNCHHLIYGAFGAPAFWNKYCHIRLWYHNSYFKILWGLQFFFVAYFIHIINTIKRWGYLWNLHDFSVTCFTYDPHYDKSEDL